MIASSLLFGCGGQKKQSSVKFTAFGTRTLVKGKPHVVLITSSSFSHCQSQPLIRLTANYRWSEIAKGFSTPAKTTWVYDPLTLGGSRQTIRSTDQPFKYDGLHPFLADWIMSGSSKGYPDGSFSVTTKFGNKPLLRNAIRVDTKKGC